MFVTMSTAEASTGGVELVGPPAVRRPHFAESHSNVSLEAGSDDGTDQDDEADEAGFDEELEQMWMQHSVKRNLGMGARTLLVIGAAMMGLRLVVESQKTRNNEWNKDYSGWSLCFFISGEWLFYVVSITMLVQFLRQSASKRQSTQWIYWAAVVTDSVYLIAVFVPPYGSLCDEYFQRVADVYDMAVENKTRETKRRLVEAYELDCTIMGSTGMLTLMSWFLITPRIIPMRKQMKALWVYIFAVILGYLLWYSYMFESRIYYSAVDMVVALALFSTVMLVARTKKYFMEKGAKSKFLLDQEQQDVLEKTYNILRGMLPAHVVVPKMRDPDGLIAESVGCASVLFIMVVDFNNYTRNKKPTEVLLFLNQLFTDIDQICKANRVTKIETVAEEYVAAVGVSPEDQREDHGPVLGRLVSMALRILATVQQEGVQLKMGVHTGPLVAGVIGRKLPRFRLFGDTINTAARYMQKGLPGELQMSEDTRRWLPPWAQVRSRGLIELKGKGSVEAFLLDHPGCQPSPGSARGSGGGARRRSSLEAMLRDHSLSSAQESSDYEAKPRIRKAKTRATRLLTRAPTRAGSKPQSVMSGHEGEDAGMDEDAEVLAKVLEEFTVPDESSLESGSLQNLLESVWTLGLGRLSDKDEEAWFHWHHINSICHKLPERLDRHFLGICITTAMDSTFMVMAPSRSLKHIYWGESAFEVFLLCRVLIMLIIKSWQKLASGDFIRAHPRPAQTGILVSYCAIVLLLHLSYTAMTNDWMLLHDHDQFVQDILDCPNDAERLSLTKVFLNDTPHYIRLNIFKVLSFTAFWVVTLVHPLRFIPSCTYVFLSYLVCRIGSWMGLSAMKFCFSETSIFVLSSVGQAWLQYTAEHNSRARFRQLATIERSQGAMESILDALLPEMVKQEICHAPQGAELPSHYYHNATICQSDLVGFTKLASTKRHDEVVELVRDLFGAFDDLLGRPGDRGKYDIWKVETVGDAYIAGQADFPFTRTNNPIHVVAFGMEVIKVTKKWSSRNGFNVGCRVGIHTGSCIGGMVGEEMQRYHLFGDFMSCLEGLESTAPEDGVQVSGSCMNAVLDRIKADNLPADQVKFFARAEKELKTSKGERVPYEDVGGAPTYIVVGCTGPNGRVA